jgi:hypothetical protein
MLGSLLAVGVSLVNHGVIDPTVFGLGFGLRFAFLAALWFIGTVVLLLLAVAARPKSSSPWPRATQVATISVAVLALFWPVVKATTLPSPEKPVSAPITPVSGAAATITAGSQWQVREQRSAMDGSKTLTVFPEAENDIQGWLEVKKPTLLVRCKERQTDVYVATGMAASVEYGTDDHAVRLRFGDGAPIAQHWSESTANDALFAPNAVQLARRMAGAKTVAFEFTPFDANPAVVRFNLDGLRPHLDTVASACGWQIAEEAKRQGPSEPPGEGEAAVISWPQGAYVRADGGVKLRNLTPLTASLTPGIHRIGFVKDGYQPQQVQVLIKADETANVEVTLVKEQRRRLLRTGRWGL